LFRSAAARCRGYFLLRILGPLLVFMSTGMALAAPANFESGTLSLGANGQIDGQEWHAVTFTRTFATRPVVVIGPATQVGGDAGVLRVRNVTTTGFEFQFDEWDALDGPHYDETLHFFALTEGTHVFGAQRWQVGRLGAVNRTAVTTTLTGFTAPPVVLTQVETTANPAAVGTTRGVKALNARVSDVLSSSFKVRLQTQESDVAAINNEGVSYIAVSQGPG
jgi:hypothetical protein